MAGFLVYREKFEIPKTKGPITLKGVSALKSVIQYGDYAEKAGSTSKSATVAVMSDYFKAEDITFSVIFRTRNKFNLSAFNLSFKSFLNMSPD